MKRHAFTLVELLVVIAIIVVLLSILMPSMSRAIYAAQLTTCGSNLKQTAYGLLSSAADTYGQFTQYNWTKPTGIKEGAVDARPALKPYIPFNDLACPFNERINYVDPPIVSGFVEWTYVWYAGWQHIGEAKGLTRPGDHFTVAGRRISVLASDQMWTQIGGQFPTTSHPGNGIGVVTAGANTGGVPSTVVYPAASWTFMRWENSAANFQAGGSTDLNYAFSDASVKLYSRVTAATTQLALLPGFRNTTGPWYIYLPAQ